jgi:protein TonB
MLFISFSFGQSKNKEPKKDFLPIPKTGTTILCCCNENSNEIYDENKTYNVAVVDIRPEMLGWIPKEKFIKENFRTPIVNGEKIDGKVYVDFTVEKDGTISNIYIIRDVGHGTGEEAKRVLQNMPRWNPAKKNGEIVRCRYAMPMLLP